MTKRQELLATVAGSVAAGVASRGDIDLNPHSDGSARNVASWAVEIAHEIIRIVELQERGA